MNPVPVSSYPAEGVPLQGRYDGLPGQPGTSAIVQYTTVNITTELPKDHIIWSLCCFLYSNPCCLGLAALIFSIKARDRKVVGDVNGAQHYGATARCLNIWATVLVSIVVLIFIITISVVAAQASAFVTANTYNYPYNYRG